MRATISRRVSSTTRSCNPAGVAVGTGVAAAAATTSCPTLDPAQLRVAPAGPVGMPVGRLDLAFDDLRALFEDVVLTV